MTEEPLSDAPLSWEEAQVAARNVVKEMRRCRCLWADVHCSKDATQEDGLCDWCGSRRPEQLRDNPNAMFHPTTDEFLGLGGAGEDHVNPDLRPDACWMPNSGRTLL